MNAAMFYGAAKNTITRFHISGLGKMYSGNMEQVYITDDNNFAVVQGKSGKFYPIVNVAGEWTHFFGTYDTSKSYKTLNGAIKFVNDWDEDFK